MVGGEPALKHRRGQVAETKIFVVRSPADDTTARLLDEGVGFTG